MFVLAITSVIGAYYYLRVVVLILSPAAGRTERVRISQLAAAALITLSGLSILPGIAPNFFLSLIQRLYGNG
jgi:NADH:ubiquinone oxidoreductase subunit 2 (subunit N)